MKSIFRFLGNVVKAVWRTVTGAIKEFVCNIEAVAILSFATIGLATILTEIPFHFMLPMWIETTMVIPIISVLAILLLTFVMQARMSNELA